MPLRVSAGTAVGTLAFVNAVLLAAESRGAVAGIDEVRGNFALPLYGHSLLFAVREQFDKELKQPQSKSPQPSQMVEVPTSRLFVAIQKPNTWQYSIHTASSNQPLNDLANLLFERLYSIVVHRREEERIEVKVRRKQLIVQREMRALAAQRERDEQEKREADGRAAIELEKEVALLEEARNWERAALIRRYLDAHGPPTTEDHVRWQTWAMQVAERIDPLKRRS
jgi:hypothetical protein